MRATHAPRRWAGQTPNWDTALKAPATNLTIGVDGSALSGPLTGVGNYVLTLLRALTSAEPNARFILYCNGPISADDLPNTEIKVSVPHGRKGPHWQNTQLAAALSADRPNVFWGGNGLLPLIRPRGMATVVTIHDLAYKYAGATIPLISRWSRTLVQPVSARIATRIVAVSRTTAEQVTRTYGREVDGIVPPLIESVFAPASPEAVQRVRDKYALPGEYLLSTGTLEPRKNLGALIDAICALRERGIALPPLVLAGRNGWLIADLVRKIAELERTGIVRPLGYVPLADMPALYTGARAFVMPSVYEGFGMPVLEAQLCGTPVMISDIPSLVEASGGYARRFAPTVDGIAAALEETIGRGADVPRRPLTTIDNSASSAARRMWEIIERSVADVRRTR